MRTLKLSSLLLVISCLAACVSPHRAAETAMQDFAARTGLRTTDQPNIMEGTHRGYPVLFRTHMGNVWGRYGARVAMGEIGRRELGVVGQFLTGSYDHAGTVVGSPFDRLLSRVIGQPLTFYVLLKHGNPRIGRADILSDFSTIAPDDLPAARGRIGLKAGTLYSNDSSYAERVLSDKGLVDRISEVRSQYIRVDDKAISFIFSGSERDWSAMIREQGGYPDLILHVMDILADLAGHRAV